MHEASDWWVLYTRHQHEKAVAEMLSAKGFEVFLPVYESIRRWKDRKKLITLPLFPCYVFVQGGLDRRLQVVTTPGIHTILFRGERVAMVPEAEIQAIRRAVEGPFRVEPGTGHARLARRRRRDSDSEEESVSSRSFRGHDGAVRGGGN
jgi:transcription antitermination factor NusG